MPFVCVTDTFRDADLNKVLVILNNENDLRKNEQICFG